MLCNYVMNLVKSVNRVNNFTFLKAYTTQMGPSGPVGQCQWAFTITIIYLVLVDNIQGNY